MAATITVTESRRHGGRPVYELRIVETSVAAATEVEVDLAAEGLPLWGRIFGQHCELTSGSGATIDPVLGSTTDPATSPVRIENDTAAAIVNNTISAGYRYGNLSSLYHRSVPDSGSDNAVTSVYTIAAGWDD